MRRKSLRIILIMPFLILGIASARAACRTFTQDVQVDTETVATSGIACQDMRGVWHIQDRDGPADFTFAGPIHFGAVTMYRNPVFKYRRIIPRYIAKPPVQIDPSGTAIPTDPAKAAADPLSRP